MRALQSERGGERATGRRPQLSTSSPVDRDSLGRRLAVVLATLSARALAWRVFTTCLFCHAALGANRELEAFQVGRRLAFDPERGRLWVVCSHCARWNLTPLEIRW
jgi:uncharacterized protein with PIN domain